MKTLENIRVGCAMTGSFCTFKKVFEAWRRLKDMGAEMIPIMSFNASQLDTRFYTAEDARATFEDIAGRKIIATLPEAEPIGPKKWLDVLVIAPCTGNTLAKLAGGISDTPVTLAAKAHLRNGRPVVIAVSSNDALSQNAANIGVLMRSRNIFFVPFGQDDCRSKPDSLVAHMDLIPETVLSTLENGQIQPKII